MAYIFKQKLQLQDLVDINFQKKKVLIHEPEEYLSGLYTHYLKGNNFEIMQCPFLEIVEQSSKIFMPDVLVFNIDVGNQETKVKWLISYKRNFPDMLIITTGFNINSEFLKKLMPAGISSHINRRLSRPEDLAVLAAALLKN